MENKKLENVISCLIEFYFMHLIFIRNTIILFLIKNV